MYICMYTCTFVSIQTRSYMSDEILKAEAEEGLEKVQDALNLCNEYQHCYYDRKSHLSHYFKDTPVIEWEFQSSMVFSQLDQFINRLRVVQVLG